MTDPELDLSGWIGHQAVDRAGDKVGKVIAVYYDEETGAPQWLALSTGAMGKKATVVPARNSALTQGQVVIGWSRASVKKGPQIDDVPDQHLDPEVEKVLYVHYGRGAIPDDQSDDQAVAPPAPMEDRPPTREEVPVVQRITPLSSDDGLTLSEEQLTVGTRTQESGRVRLRKYIVTEQVSETLPVSHEQVRIERRPVTDDERAAASGSVELSEEEHEIILYEQRPVVHKEVVPVERVRLFKETVAGRATIDEEVRKERVGLEADAVSEDPR